MVNHLFPNFLNNVAEYHDAEKYWQQLCQEVIQQHSKASDWSPWLNTHFVDGSLMEPGNPIYHLRSPSLKKAVQIIQVDPTSDVVSVSSWVDEAGDDCSPSMALQVLVIHCELSAEAAVEVRRLLIDWVKPKDLVTK